MILGVLAGMAVLTLLYGAFAAESVPTGKVSASLVNYSAFSMAIGSLVIVMAVLALRHSTKKAHVLGQ